MILNLAENPFLGFQGEGITQGKHSLFIRFSSCNLTCKFCDSKFSWSKKGIQFELNDLDKFKNVSNVVITGGEPLLYKNEIVEIIKFFGKKVTYEIETNGTIKLENKYLNFFNKNNVLFNVSPKINVEQNVVSNLEPILLTQKLKKCIIKIIIFDLEKDLETINYFKKYNKKIVLQPEGTDSTTIKNSLKKNYESLIKLGYDISIREHIFLFENKQGV